MGQLKTVTATIASSASLSGEIDVSPWRVIAIQMPADWDAANLTFQARPTVGATNVTLQDVYDDNGNEVTITVAADRYVALNGTVRDALDGLATVKVRSGTTGTAVNQGAARTLGLVVERRA